jgi:hypothetical protein
MHHFHRTAVALTLVAAVLLVASVGLARTAVRSAPPPFYTFGGIGLMPDGSLFSVNDGEWAAIAFYRSPEDAPDGFDFLNDFDPNVGEAGLHVLGDVLLDDAGNVVRAGVTGLGAVPIWFVRVEELEALAADETLTKEELMDAQSLVVGYASRYGEENHLEGVHPVSHLTIVAGGDLEDGGIFTLRAVEVGLELKQVEIVFED